MKSIIEKIKNSSLSEYISIAFVAIAIYCTALSFYNKGVREERHFRNIELISLGLGSYTNVNGEIEFKYITRK